jgi:mRNA-degrading endonuclease RelE of RelBE toxin-antitoxin system
MAYEIQFAEEVDAHLEVLTSGQKARVFDAIERQLAHEPALKTKNRKPMDPDRRTFVAPWELRIGELRVYYAVKSVPKRVIVVAIGVKVRERVLIAGKEVER